MDICYFESTLGSTRYGYVVACGCGVGVSGGGGDVGVGIGLRVGCGGDFVLVGAGTSVLVGIIIAVGGTGVELGRSVGTRVGIREGVVVRVRKFLASAVALSPGVCVLEGVMVAEAVMVGVAEINGVGVGVEEVVGVGIVRVGKGFRSESAVAAMAVFVPLASACVPPSPEAVMSLNETTYTTNIRPMHSTACNKICRGSRFSCFTMSAFL
jgi:hypothetical protein